MHFFTLFVYLYDRAFGLGSSLKRVQPEALPRGLTTRLKVADQRFRTGELPPDVLQAVSGAATDLGKRRKRLDFLRRIADGKTR